MVFPSRDPREQAIVDYLTKTLHDFDDDTTPSGLTDPKPRQELNVTTMGYASGTPPTGTRTTVVTVYSNQGGPYPNTYYKSFGYDDATKAAITFRSLLRPDSQPLNVILPIVQEEMTRQAGQPITIDPGL